MTDTIVASPRLEHFPISFFAMAMGMSGLTIGWEKAQHILGMDLKITPWLIVTTSLLFVVLALSYVMKLALYRQAVLAELRHPVKLNYFPTISISLLLLSIAFLPLVPNLAQGLWLAGTGLHLAFTLYVVNVWMHHEHFKIQHMNPAWFFPAVGNVLVPVVGASLGYVEVSWFFFSVGLLFWVMLMTIILYRVMFHDPIDERLMPTLFILIAPPALAFIAYSNLVPTLDPFARVLYYGGLFFTLLLFTQAGRFLRLRFFLSWWAYSVPLAAISIASLVMFERTGADVYRYLGFGLLILLTGIVAFLLVRTGIAVWRQAICVPGQ